MVIGFSDHGNKHWPVKRIGLVNGVLDPSCRVPLVVSIKINPVGIPPPSSIDVESFIGFGAKVLPVWSTGVIFLLASSTWSVAVVSVTIHLIVPEVEPFLVASSSHTLNDIQFLAVFVCATLYSSIQQLLLIGHEDCRAKHDFRCLHPGLIVTIPGISSLGGDHTTSHCEFLDLSIMKFDPLGTVVPLVPDPQQATTNRHSRGIKKAWLPALPEGVELLPFPIQGISIELIGECPVAHPLVTWWWFGGRGLNQSKSSNEKGDKQKLAAHGWVDDELLIIFFDCPLFLYNIFVYRRSIPRQMLRHRVTFQYVLACGVCHS